MRAVIQRVSQARVEVGTEIIGQIKNGLLVFLAIEEGDGEEDVTYIANKIAGVRVFEDDKGKLNLSAESLNYPILLISQFTLAGDVRKGRRPSFTTAACPEVADTLYEDVAEAIRARGIHVETGRFQTHMQVHLTNDGPVTILVASDKTF